MARETWDHVYETTVPPEFEAVRGLARQWCEDVSDHVGTRFNDCYGADVGEVENQARDGFYPYTQGGFEGIVTATLAAADSTGSAPAVIQPYIDQDIKDAEEEWDRQNPEHPIAWIYAEDSVEREIWRERWGEFQYEWMSEGGTYFYKVRCLFFGENNRGNQTGKPEIYFMVGINTDFEYGRDEIPWLSAYGSKTQQTEWCWEKTVPVDEITPELIDSMTRDAIDALTKL